MTDKAGRSPENIRLGQNLKRIRVEQGYTQEGLSKISGVTKNFISDIERGNRGMGRVTVDRLCDALLTDEVTLRFGSGEPAEPAGPADYVALDALIRGLSPIELLEARLILEKFVASRGRVDVS